MGSAGLEPATSALSEQRSNQAELRARTKDLKNMFVYKAFLLDNATPPLDTGHARVKFIKGKFYLF